MSTEEATVREQQPEPSNGVQGRDRWFYGLIAVGLGIVAILIALLIVVSAFDTAADVGAVLGAVAAPIGTLVAAYFGVQVGSAGKEESDEAARRANEETLALALTSDPQLSQRFLEELRQLRQAGNRSR